MLNTVKCLTVGNQEQPNFRRKKVVIVYIVVVVVLIVSYYNSSTEHEHDNSIYRNYIYYNFIIIFSCKIKIHL